MKEIMKRLCVVFATLLLLTAPALANSEPSRPRPAKSAKPARPSQAQQIKLMSTFLSNFTEVGLFDFDLREDGDFDVLHLGGNPSHPDLIRFGILHNYINNYKSRIKLCPKKGCEHGSLVVDAKFVAESVKKYFDINLEHDSIEDQTDPSCHFDGKVYHFDRVNSGAVYYAEVKQATQKGDVVHMTGDIYNTKNKKDRPYTFEATAKPYKWGGKNTWSIISMRTRSR